MRWICQAFRVKRRISCRFDPPCTKAPLAESLLYPDIQLLNIVRMLGIIRQTKKLSIQAYGHRNIVVDRLTDFRDR